MYPVNLAPCVEPWVKGEAGARSAVEPIASCTVAPLIAEEIPTIAMASTFSRYPQIFAINGDPSYSGISQPLGTHSLKSDYWTGQPSGISSASSASMTAAAASSVTHSPQISGWLTSHQKAASFSEASFTSIQAKIIW